MKKIILFIVLCLSCLYMNAQEPKNNLRKSLVQIQQAFPDLTYSGDEDGYKIYKSESEDNDYTRFFFSNGRLVGEYTYIFDYSDSGYITDLYDSLLDGFARYGVKHKRNTSSTYDITFFYFSNFIVKIANYGTQLQLYYELNGYNIKINAIQARPPRY